ncbi:lipocalin-like domain-containing protein [Lactobacillus corticis]|uniref:AttH domain-containing protein n=1 Tax=Lactobacillus corticis TaxID=2201249 RepID=A0A916QHC1_9LACO|nr:lipocalin-like domain-containing protein [Lactobacillus corticis]GFZ27380.1 hypothetical protein LCB40_12600 [Lactobacillus corticis]
MKEMKNEGLITLVDEYKSLTAERDHEVDSWYINLNTEVDGSKIGFTWHQSTMAIGKEMNSSVEICMMDLTRDIWFAKADCLPVDHQTFTSEKELNVQSIYGGLKGNEKKMHLNVAVDDDRVDLILTPGDTTLFNSGAGFFKLFNTSDCWEYAWPNMCANGTITLAGKTYEIKNASAWFDRQINDQMSIKDFTSKEFRAPSWTWIGFNPAGVSTGVGAFSLWDNYLNGKRYTYATVVMENGGQLYTPATVTYSDVWTSSQTKNIYPKKFHISIPVVNIELDYQVMVENQEFIQPAAAALSGSQAPFSVKGIANGKKVDSFMIVEMIGGIQLDD